MSDYKKYTSDIAEAIEMEGKPVLVKYSNDYDETKFINEPNLICQSIQDARYGASLIINENNSSCKGGNYFLGLSPFNSQLINFWTDIEVSHYNSSACIDFIENIKPIPYNISNNVLLSWDYNVINKPDLIIFICNAENLAKFLGVYNFAYGNGVPIISYTAACSAAIGIPMGRNNMNVTFIDNSARRIADFRKNELMITIPLSQLESIHSALNQCIWGGIEAPYKKIENKFIGSWQRYDLRRN